VSAASADLSALDASELEESALDESDDEDESSLDLDAYDKIRYDTRYCVNVCSEANMNQLNLPHGTDNYKKWKTEKKLTSKKGYAQK